MLIISQFHTIVKNKNLYLLSNKNKLNVTFNHRAFMLIKFHPKEKQELKGLKERFFLPKFSAKGGDN